MLRSLDCARDDIRERNDGGCGEGRRKKGGILDWGIVFVVFERGEDFERGTGKRREEHNRGFSACR